jgi:uncharacterized damage-inducible protein DinB
MDNLENTSLISRLPWVDRKFDFNLPIEMFPNIIERVRGTPARLEDLIKSLSSEILTSRINGKWSIQEHAGHLSDLETLHEGRLDDFLSGKEILRAADMSNKKTNEANHNSRNIHDILKEFRTNRMNFVKRLENLDAKQVSLESLHPRLKQKMRIIDNLFFVAEHDDHHLASITEIIRTLRK